MIILFFIWIILIYDIINYIKIDYVLEYHGWIFPIEERKNRSRHAAPSNTCSWTQLNSFELWLTNCISMYVAIVRIITVFKVTLRSNPTAHSVGRMDLCHDLTVLSEALKHKAATKARSQDTAQWSESTSHVPFKARGNNKSFLPWYYDEIKKTIDGHSCSNFWECWMKSVQKS